MIERADLISALVDLFDGWIKPYVQFSTGPLPPEDIDRLACQFYALNCFAFQVAGIAPKDLILQWSKRSSPPV